MDPNVSDINTRNGQGSNVPEQKIEEKPKPKFNKKLIFIILGILAIGIAALLLSTFFSNVKKSQPVEVIKATPLPEDTLLASVDNNDIFVSDLNHFASTTLGNRRLGKEDLKKMLDILVERKILDSEVASRSIQINPPEGNKNETYYEQVRKKIIEGEVKTINVTDIGWWLPPFNDYEQTALSNAQRAEQESASKDVELMLRNNRPTLEILQYVSNTYPNISKSLAINGTRYEPTADNTSLELDRTHDYNEELLYFPRYAVMFKMSEGQITRNVWEDGSGADIIKANVVSRGADLSYSDWLKQQIESKVIYNTQAIESL